MWDLEDLLSKLNPMAEEFVTPSLTATYSPAYGGGFMPVASPTGHGFVFGFPADVGERVGHGIVGEGPTLSGRGACAPPRISARAPRALRRVLRLALAELHWYGPFQLLSASGCAG
ncbi:hypothetical protein GUJ93_ZPchr0007g4048 [Zizania palustris]|uniref:Uncharacterized protein n=1 Tax=Zizania palustris TaxID=103762 RepID=A0A8J5SZS6_ZIZPA|nr:hypothetical protein GUJ93_ZPchr0007g4048 [Zizania palustris]